MKKRIASLFLSVVMLLSMCLNVSAAEVTHNLVQGSGGAARFTDVPRDYTFYNDIDAVVGSGLFAGTTATTFSPHREMTRAMFVVVLSRLEGHPELENQVTATVFSDVPSTRWAAGAIAWANSNGIVEGYTLANGTREFRPDTPISRAQICALVDRYIRYKGYTLREYADATTRFTDASMIPEVFRESVERCRVSGLIRGFADGYLRPNIAVTRAQVAAILNRIITVTFDENTENLPVQVPGAQSGGEINAVNGTTTWSVSRNGQNVANYQAAAGDLVTLTFNPDAGYMVGTVSVKDANGADVPVTMNGPRSATFTMPSAMPVSVGDPYVPIYSFTDASQTNGNSYVSLVERQASNGTWNTVATGTSDGELSYTSGYNYIDPGDRFTVSHIANTYYQHLATTVRDNRNSVVTSTRVNDSSTTFILPEQLPVVIDVSYGAVSSGGGGGGGGGGSSYRATTLNVTLNRGGYTAEDGYNGYELSSTASVVSSRLPSGVQYAEWGPSAVITTSTTTVNTAKITLNPANGYTANVTGTVDGETLTLTPVEGEANSYSFDIPARQRSSAHRVVLNVTYSTGSVEPGDTATLNVTLNRGYNAPANSNTATVTGGAKTLTLDQTKLNDSTTVVKGNTVTVTVNKHEDFDVKVTLNDVEQTPTAENANVYEFTVDADATVNITFTRTVSYLTLNIEQPDGANNTNGVTLTADSGLPEELNNHPQYFSSTEPWRVTPGTVITVTVNAVEGYKLKGIDGGDNLKSTGTEEIYRLTIPATGEDVTLDVVFVSADTPDDTYTVKVEVTPAGAGTLTFHFGEEFTLPTEEISEKVLENALTSGNPLVYNSATGNVTDDGTYTLKSLVVVTRNGEEAVNPEQPFGASWLADNAVETSTNTDGSKNYVITFKATFGLEQAPDKAVSYSFTLESYNADGQRITPNQVSVNLSVTDANAQTQDLGTLNADAVNVDGEFTNFTISNPQITGNYEFVNDTDGNHFQIQKEDGTWVSISEDDLIGCTLADYRTIASETADAIAYKVSIHAIVAEKATPATYTLTTNLLLDNGTSEVPVSASELQGVTVTVTDDQNNNIPISTGTQVAAGTKVTITTTFTDDSPYEVASYGNGLTEVDDWNTDNYPPVITFTMPAGNLNVDLGFRLKTVTHTVTVDKFVVGSTEALPESIQNINIEMMDGNGEIYPNADGTFTINEGTTVTITVFANAEGYRFSVDDSTVKASDTDTDTHNKAKVDNFSFSFTVDTDLTVGLAFIASDPDKPYLDVSVKNAEGGTVTVNGVTVENGSYGGERTKDESVTINATPNADYEVLYRIGSSGEYTKLEAPYNIPVTMDGDKSVDIEFRSLKNYTLTVVMEENPDANASVTVAYTDRSGNPVSAPYSDPVTTIPEGTPATVTVTNDPTYYPYYRIYKTADGSGNAEWTSYTNAVTVPDENGFYDDYTFEVEFRQTATLRLVIDPAGGKGTATATYASSLNGLSVSNVNAGDVSSKSSTEHPIEDEEITIKWTGDIESITFVDGSDPNKTAADATTTWTAQDLSDGEKTFAMPANSAIVTVKFVRVYKEYKLNVNVTETSGGTVTVADADGTAVTSGSNVKEETPLTLTVSKNDGYRIKSVKVDGKDVTLKNGTYTFKMPAKNTDVDVVFEAKTYTVNLVLNDNSPDKSGSAEAFVDGSTTATAFGQTIENVDYDTEFDVYPSVENEDYRVSSVVFQPEGQSAQKVDARGGRDPHYPVNVKCEDDDVTSATITVNITDANLRDFTLNYTGTGEFSADIVGTRDGNTVTERVTHKTAGNPVSVTKNSDTTPSTVTVKVTLDDTIITGATLNGADYTGYTVNDDGTVTFNAITVDDDTVLTLALEETVWGYNMYAGLDFGKLTDYNFRVFDIPETDDLMEAMHRINDNTEDGNTDTQNADVVARFLSAFGDELSKVKSEIPVTDEQLIRSMIDKEARAKATDTVNQYVKNLDPSGESEIPQTMKDQVSELIIDQIEPALANLPFPVTRDDVEVNWEGGQFNVNVLNEGGIEGFTQALLDCLGFEIGSEIKVVLNAVPNNTTHMLKMSAVLQEIDVNVSVDTDNLPKLQFEGRGNLSFTVKLKTNSYDLTGMLAEGGITVENGVATVPINSGRQEIELTDINKIAGTIHSDPRYVDISSLLNADQIGRLTDNFYNKIDKIDSAEVRTAVYALFDPDSKYVDEPFVHFEMVEDGESTILQSIKVHTYEILSLDAPQNGERLRLTIDLDPTHWNEIIDEAIDRVNAVREAIIADTATYNPASSAFVGHIGNGAESGYTVYINTALEDIYTNNQKVANALALSNPTMKQSWKALKPSLNADMTQVELDVDTALSFGDGAMAQIADILIQAFAEDPENEESIDLNLYWRLERSQIPSTDN